ncbi:MAG: hypothetical protein U0X71_06410 [Sphingobacteriaceae bacterium]|nr:MAG: hypothetical protein E6Q66_08255 [Pedobacter sp.]
MKLILTNILALFTLLISITSCKKDDISTQLNSPTIKAEGRISGIALKDHILPNGSIIRIKYIDTDSKNEWFKNEQVLILKQLVKESTEAWEKHANIKFEFIDNDKDADVRIILDFFVFRDDLPTGSYNRYIDDQDKPNMKLRYRFGQSNNSFRATALHEFGHVLGLDHEHCHPDSKVNISQLDGIDQMPRDLETGYFHHKTYDPLSIMHYGFPGSMTKDGKDIKENLELSAGDITFIQTLYPF